MLALVGCATPAPTGGGAASTLPAVSSAAAKQDLVRQRAMSRWDLLIKDDMDAAYTYMSAGSRESLSLQKYKANFRRGAFREARVDSVTCDGDACVARLYVTYDHQKMKGITTPIVESWIIDGGQAWYVSGGQ